jgi:TolB-like protein
MNKKNIRNPPESDNFADLFHYLWNHGLGKPFNRDGIPSPWTSEDMEHAFESFGKPISIRTIQHWRSGRFLPSRKNMHILARIISGGDDVLKQKWSDALISTLNKEKRQKPQPTPSPIEEPIVQNTEQVLRGKQRHPAWFLTLLFIGLCGSWWLFRPTSNSIAVATFQNLSANSELTYLTQGLTEDIHGSLVKIEKLDLLPRRSVRAIESDANFIDKIKKDHKVRYILEGNMRVEGNTEKISVSLVDLRRDKSVWGDTFDPNSLNLFDIHRTVLEKVSEKLNVPLPTELNQEILSYGTDNVEAYSHYLKGRHLVKYWHENRSGDSIWLANAAFDRALAIDRKMGLASFHKADAYYHFAAGDDISPKSLIQTQIPTSSSEAMELVQGMMGEANRNANKPSESAQARVNAVYFSDNWNKLRSFALEYEKFTTKERGELEWFFGPVVLLFLNEERALHSLIEDRVLRYDPLNGTGHAYAIRQYLISDQREKAWERLQRAEVATFSNRIDEVKGYLLFADQDGEALEEHVRTATNLSALHQDYFLVLSQYLKAKTPEEKKTAKEEAKRALICPDPPLNCSLLQKDKPHVAFGLNHIGETVAASEMFNEITKKPMGTILLSVAMSYGAACGPEVLPTILTLDEKMKNAGISKLPCIGSSKSN